ncbi:14 kDa phosphohistidine phosphatase-like [Microplitis mediator]|uniref:14 kDa phosphohistidine phosphatase-like n=1 Tax=Microplitis mediator TaxID=375433 RepID=UPI00255401E4|nr:14 kDa phosphohistidine phosphatase-like [Microplitis mediator]
MSLLFFFLLFMAVSVILSTLTRVQSSFKINRGSIGQFRRLSKMSEALDKIPDVIIDPNGVFKYILVYIHDDNTKQSKPIVRGYKKCKFHADIYETIGEDELKNYGAGLDTECVGGGRINHNAPAKTIKVYGYSQGFGKADHTIAVGLLKKKYPDYEITWSDEGY